MSDIKKRLNITGRCYIKKNNADGFILSFLPNVPLKAKLNDLLFILTIPNEDQKYASAYCRLQDKSRLTYVEEGETKKFQDVRSVGHLKNTKKGNIIVCAPKENVEVTLNEIVVIATIPAEDKTAAPCYIREKVYEKSKDELKKQTVEDVLEVNGNQNYTDFVDEVTDEPYAETELF